MHNAFNSRHRGSILHALFQEDSLQSFWRFSHWAYSMPSELLTIQ